MPASFQQQLLPALHGIQTASSDHRAIPSALIKRTWLQVQGQRSTMKPSVYTEA